MDINFYKYQGAGNDFILIDHRESKTSDLNYNLIAKLCNRRFGIGADGLMFLLDHDTYDFEMLYFNADGKPGSMCGNGGRCIVALAKFLKIIDREARFLAVDGPHYAKISEEGNWVDLQMIDVDLIKKDGDAFILNTGSPHYVKQVTDLSNLDVYTEGKRIRNNDTYKAEGINVNFIEDKGDHLFVRTFERGVEEETYACGTGVTAVALSMAKYRAQNGHFITPIKALGGELRIEFDYDGLQFTHIFLCGPAEQVFQGKITV